MKLSEKALRRIIQEEFASYLEEGCVRTAIDKSVVHRGSGDLKRSYVQIKTTELCDDDIQTPTEKAAKQSALEKKRKAVHKKQTQRGKEWRKDKDKQKQMLARPDKVS